jgi:hypothetical protein
MCRAGHDWLRRVSYRGNNIVRRHSKCSELAVTKRASCPEFDALLLQCCYSSDTISPWSRQLRLEGKRCASRLEVAS